MKHYFTNNNQIAHCHTLDIISNGIYYEIETNAHDFSAHSLEEKAFCYLLCFTRFWRDNNLVIHLVFLQQCGSLSICTYDGIMDTVADHASYGMLADWVEFSCGKTLHFPKTFRHSITLKKFR